MHDVYDCNYGFRPLEPFLDFLFNKEGSSFLNKKKTIGKGTQKKILRNSNRFIIISLICSFPYQFESCPKNVPLDYAILHQEENDSNSYKRQGVRRNEFIVEFITRPGLYQV